MPLELQERVLDLVRANYGGRLLPTPEWLIRPGREECGRRWRKVREIYSELTGLELPETMRPAERRTVDAVLRRRGQAPRIVEVDEKQHFNEFRALTLRGYPRGVELAFPKRLWIERSLAKKRLEGGGFAKPKPPLFPGPNGRHRQRAYRDALTDLLSGIHGYLPTLRIADFEVEGWLFDLHAKRRMRDLMDQRL